jgi:hypothetical protein
MADCTHWLNVGDCLGRTCLKWSADGELTALDLSLVLQRLAQVDQQMNCLHQAAAGRHCPVRRCPVRRNARRCVS